MKKSRIASLFLVLALVMGLSVPALADKEFDLQGEHTSGPYTYNVNEDGTATITAFNKDFSILSYTLDTLSIPAQLDGHQVVSLGTYSFSYNMPAGVKRIVIPEGVQRIEQNAFLCSSANPVLTELSLPSTLTYIGSGAFSAYTSLQTLVIPENVTFIGANAFYSMERDETHGLKTVYCYARDVEFEGNSFFGSDAFRSCRNCVFYGYPGSTLEQLVNTYLLEVEESTQQPDGSWLAARIPTGNEFRDISTAPDPGTSQPGDSEEPAQPETDTAYATAYSILVDGQAVDFDAYALKDENGNDTNYLKLRDVAQILNGSQAQFQVGWDGAANAISITTGQAYTPNGSEMSTPFSGDRAYAPNQAAVLVDGAEAGLEAITLTDDAGNGYTYFKLRDLGAALGFNVTWDADAGAIVIDTTQDYQG